MNRKVLLTILVVVALLLAGVVAWTMTKPVSQEEQISNPPESSQQEYEPADENERVLEEARNFQPSGACTTVMTPAKHIETGVTYTFPSGCIPDGWEKLPPSSAN